MNYEPKLASREIAWSDQAGANGMEQLDYNYPTCEKESTSLNTNARRRPRLDHYDSNQTNHAV